MRSFASFAILIAGLSLACGGSTHSGSGGTTTPPPPTPAAGVVAGVVGGTPDAPQINHVPLGMSGATVTMNGQSATSSMVQPGTVMAGMTTAGGMGMGGSGYTMQSVQLMSSFMGSIQTLDQTSARLTVMGQAIQMNALTQLAQENQDGTYAGLTMADFQPGDFVSVHGSFLADGSYTATRVERRKPGMDTSQNGTMGQVANLDTTAKTFNLGTWTVKYDSATVNGTLANGVWAQARGTLSGTQITAAWVNVMGALGGPGIGSGMGMGLRGLVVNLDATAKTFTLMALTVNYAQATVVGTLAEGAMVEVEGSLATGSSTILNATKVEVEFPAMGGGSGMGGGTGGGMGSGSGVSNLQVNGTITALDLTAMTLTVSGSTFWMDSSTLVMSHDAPMAASQLKVGDWVAVMADSAKKNGAGYAYAARISEMATGGGGMGASDLMGLVTSVNASGQTLVMNGFTISVTSGTTYASQGASVTAATFWAAVKVGSKVEAFGTPSGSTFVATRLVLGSMGGMGGGM